MGIDLTHNAFFICESLLGSHASAEIVKVNFFIMSYSISSTLGCRWNAANHHTNNVITSKVELSSYFEHTQDSQYHTPVGIQSAVSQRTV